MMKSGRTIGRLLLHRSSQRRIMLAPTRIRSATGSNTCTGSRRHPYSCSFTTTASTSVDDNDNISNSPPTSRYMQSKEIKERTLQEWTRLTEKLLLDDDDDDDHDDHDDCHSIPTTTTTNNPEQTSTSTTILETIRFWTTQRTPQAIDHALLLLGKLVQQQHRQQQQSNDNDDELPKQITEPYWMTGNYPQSTHVLNAILDAWRICWREQQQQQQQQHKQQPTSNSRSSGSSRERKSPLPTPRQLRNHIEAWADDDGVVLNARSYSLLMVSSNDQNANDAAALECWHAMLQRNIMPDMVAATTVLQSIIAASAKPIATAATTTNASNTTASSHIQPAHDFFQHVLELYDTGRIEECPTTVFYNTFLQVLTKHRHVGPATEFLHAMKTCSYRSVTPNLVTYRLVVWAWVQEAARLWKQQTPTQPWKDTAKNNQSNKENIKYNAEATRAMRQALALVQDGTDQIVDASFYSKLISTTVQCSKNYALADEIFEALQTAYAKTGEDRLEPEVLTLRAMLLLYAKTRRPQRAMELLHGLEAAGEAKRGNYRDIIFAWLNTNQAEEAAKLLERMMEKREWYFCPDASMIDEVLKATSRHLDAPFTEALVRRIHQVHKETQFARLAPHPQQWVRMLSAWSHSKSANASQRVLELVEEMNRLAGVDRSHMLAAVKALIRTKAPIETILRLFPVSEKIQPDASLLNVLVQACIDTHAPNEAHDMFKLWLDLSSSGAGQPAPPTSPQCDKVLKLLSRTPKFEPARTQAVLERFPHPRPLHYLRVLKAWSHSRDQDAVWRIQLLIGEMENKFAGHQDDKLRLNQKHYTAAIKALSRARAPVEDILRVWQQACLTSARHDEAFYSVLIKACADGGDGPRAQIVWDAMKKEGVNPNVDMLNLVILAWSRSKEDASQNANKLFAEARETISPNHSTFQLLMDCLPKDERHAELLESYRREHIRLKTMGEKKVA